MLIKRYLLFFLTIISINNIKPALQDLEKVQLFEAAKNNDIETVTNLIEAYPKLLYARTGEDLTLMHIAAKYNAIDVIRKIANIDIDFIYKTAIKNGFTDLTPLQVAGESNSDRAFEELIKLAKQLAPDNKNYLDNELIYAAKNNRLKTAIKLINAGANVNYHPVYLWGTERINALGKVVLKNNIKQTKDMIILLISKGSDLTDLDKSEVEDHLTQIYEILTKEIDFLEQIINSKEQLIKTLDTECKIMSDLGKIIKDYLIDAEILNSLKKEQLKMENSRKLYPELTDSSEEDY